MLPIACQTAGPNGFTFLGGRAVLKAKQNSNFFSQKKKLQRATPGPSASC